jgi:FAD:protein FMN transferase
MQAAAPSLLLATSAMATRFELVIGDDRADARAIGEAALEEIELCHRRLSRFAPDSLLSHINRTAAVRAVRLDAETFALLREALTVRLQSGGAFDIDVGGHMDALRTGAATQQRPAADDVGIELDERACTVRFARADISLDLGGIAKGHAIDRAVAVLREYGVRSALLHGGTSSVAAIGAPPGSAGWRVALARVPGAPQVVLCDSTLSVSWPGAPSGESAHIVDPRTGRVAGSVIVGVVGKSARLGDAWSTALAVLGHRPAAMPAELTTCISRPGSAAEWSGPAAPVEQSHG